MFCNWPVDYGTDDNLPCAPLQGDTPTAAAKRQKFELMAAEYLWRYSGRQFGLCPGVIRPCRQQNTAGVSTYGPPPGSAWQPNLVAGQWITVSCGMGHGSSCGCDSGMALQFETPVYSVTEVRIDGAALPEDAYRLDNSRLLVRQDGRSWPFCQDLSRTLGEPGTWSVTVALGSPVPAGGQIAAGKLACELAKAAEGAKGCELPARWQSITRQGVSISAALDTFEGLDDGKTGIWLIDSWVASVTKPDIGFSIASPDYRGVGRQTRGPVTPPGTPPLYYGG